jgi:TonB family protein
MSKLRLNGRAGGMGMCLLLASVLGAGMAFTQSRLRYAPAIVSRAEPDYPAAAKRKGVEGAVKLDVSIGPDGHVTKVEVVSGNSALTDAAKTAVTRWRFRPTLLNGEAVEVVTTVCVPFTLSKRTPPPCGTKRRIRY